MLKTHGNLAVKYQRHHYCPGGVQGLKVSLHTPDVKPLGGNKESTAKDKLFNAT